jgi:hypothetical protein
MSSPDSPGVSAVAVDPSTEPEAPREAPSGPENPSRLPPWLAEGVLADWARLDGPWWAASFVFHALLMCVLMLLATLFGVVDQAVSGEAPEFESTQANEKPEQPLIPFDVGEPPLDPSELSTESLSLNQAPDPKDDEKPEGSPGLSSENLGGGMLTGADDAPSLGGLGGGFDVLGMGAGIGNRGTGGVGSGVGTGTRPGSGGAETGFAGRSSTGKKTGTGAFGGTRRTERAVGAALNWLARHQNSDGSWGMSDYRVHCPKDDVCGGPGNHISPAGATALSLLPFLGAGQTPYTKGPYQTQVGRGLVWLMKNQEATGDLAPKAQHKMYSHGLATIVLCEAYGLIRSQRQGERAQVEHLGERAQLAVNFIQSAQNATGGWRYEIEDRDADTSVVAWQVMALKSAHMAGLKVNPAVFSRAKQCLETCAKGDHGGLFSYQPKDGPTPPMTAAALLCYQYLGTRRDSPAVEEGVRLLMRNMPDNANRDTYYWYYATQVMHNIPGPDWDAWNRQMRKTLIETQCKKGCATGSWDPIKPSEDKWGPAGGRVMSTALSTLSLEVYYRFLPLYKLDQQDLLKLEDLSRTSEKDPAEKKPAQGEGEKSAEGKPAAEKPERPEMSEKPEKPEKPADAKRDPERPAEK